MSSEKLKHPYKTCKFFADASISKQELQHIEAIAVGLILDIIVRPSTQQLTYELLPCWSTM
jgi:hypothetical protein